MARKIARNVTVLTVDAHDVLAYFIELTYNYSNTVEDGKGAIDRHKRPVAVGSESSLEIGAHVEGSHVLITQARTDPNVLVSFTLEGTVYTNIPGVITTARTTANRNAIQGQNCTIELDEN